MEFVDGPTIYELIQGAPLSATVAAVVGARIASALDYVHSRRFIHRDLKPSNMMLTKAGEVKLMDFGIIKDMDAAGAEQLTKEGVVLGTPEYMSPEQADAKPVDLRTDIFSLGVILYEALSGKRPFEGRTFRDISVKIRNGEYVPLAEVAPTVPMPLVEIVSRALRPEPEKRFASAAEMQRQLDLFIAQRVKVSHRLLLMSFLVQRKMLTRVEAHSHMTQADLDDLATWQSIQALI